MASIGKSDALSNYKTECDVFPCIPLLPPDLYSLTADYAMYVTLLSEHVFHKSNLNLTESFKLLASIASIGNKPCYLAMFVTSPDALLVLALSKPKRVLKN